MVTNDLSALTPEMFTAAFAEMDVLERKRLYRDDPVLWAKDILGVQLWSKQKEIAYSVRDNRNTAVAAGHSLGKDLPLDTPIPTPSGWSTIGELRVGDEVYDERGKPCRVVGKSEVFNLPLFEVTFSDGAKVRTSSSHEWNTIDRYAAKKARRATGGVQDWRDFWHLAATRETGEIAKTLHYRNGRTAEAANHIVPIAGPLEAPGRELPLHPYVTGAWLGDGTSIRPEMTVGDDGLYIVKEFHKAGYTLTKTPKGRYRYTFARQGAREALVEAGLLGNKHIPSEYQRASIAQRRDLLRGLMDTDGFVANGNVCGIDLMNKRLAYDVVELIRGLGVRASITPGRTYLDGRDVGTRYRIVFNSTWSPFTHGQYKDLKWREGAPGTMTSRRTMRTIVNVEPAPSVPTQCIQVDSDSHLYLATEHLIPTHNSFLAAVLACWWVDVHPPEETRILSTAPTYDQVSGILWNEIRKWHSVAKRRHEEYRRRKALGQPLGEYEFNDHPLPGRVTSSDEWKSEEGLELGIGRKPPDNLLDSAFQGVHCLDEQHEILTKRGWVGIDGIRDDDTVLSVPVDGEQAEWMPVTAIHRYDYDGPLEVYESRSVNFAVTPNHRFPAKGRQALLQPWSLKPYAEMTPDFRLRRLVGWEGESVAIPSEFNEWGFESVEDFARFLGYWAGDGGTRTHANGTTYETLLYGTKLDPAMFLPAGFKHGRGRDHVAVSDKCAATWLHENVGRYQHERRIPRFMLDAPPLVLDAFLDGFWLAEGTFERDGARKAIYSTSKDLIEGVAEMMIKLGHTPTFGVNRKEGATVGAPRPGGGVIKSSRACYTLAWNKSPQDSVVWKKNAKTVHHVGRVWCISTPYETFFTRRNGRVIVSGNSPYLLVIGDEGSGLPTDLVDALGNNAVGSQNRQLIIANPTNPASRMAEFWKTNNPDWNLFNISVFDSPTITGEDFPFGEDEGMSGWAYVEEKKRDWGEDDPRYISRVLGQWAFESGETVFTEDELVKSMNTIVVPDQDAKPRDGWDIARSERGDSTVGYRALEGEVWKADDFGNPIEPTGRRGIRVRIIDSWKGAPLVGSDPENPGSSTRIDEKALEAGSDLLVIDATGLGAGVVDGLRDLGFGKMKYKVMEYFGAAAPTDKRAYLNARAEHYFGLKKLMHAESVDLDGSDEKMIDELRGITYEYTDRGQRKIKSKDEIRKKMQGKSPDFADAVIYATADVSPLLDPLNQLNKGDRVYVDPREVMALERSGPGYPL